MNPKKCPNCGGDTAIRNPTGKCDHLKYPENLPDMKDTKKATISSDGKHELTEIIVKWLYDNGYSLLPIEKVILQNQVLLPYLKKHEALTRLEIMSATHPDLWGIEKRKEQAEWLKKLINTNDIAEGVHDVATEKKIDQAFQLEETIEEKVTNMINHSSASELADELSRRIIQAVREHDKERR